MNPARDLFVWPGSVGGTPANRLIHNESKQLLIGPYVIDASAVRPDKKGRRRKKGPRWNAHLEDVAADSEGLEITLGQGLVVSGRVMDENGASLERFVIQAMPEDGRNTFMIGENKVGSCCLEGWAHTDSAVATCAIPPNVKLPNGQPYPSSEWQNTYSFSSYHAGGVQFALADGSVRFIGDSISLDVYRALATRGAGEVAQMP